MVNFTGFSEIFVDINFVDIMFKTIKIAHNNLAVSYAKQEATFASALKHAIVAVKLAPEEANYYDTLALAYYKSQMYSEAEEAVKKAIELEPQNQSHLDRLTQILHSRGNQ